MSPSAGMKEKMSLHLKSYDQEQDRILSRIKTDENVQKMKKYVQHGCVSTFEHCENVARLSYKIDKRLSLHSDMEVLLTGAMLHDFFLYDWHEAGDGSHHLHGFRHAESACENAKRVFDINDKTAHVIYCHMWPLNPGRIPMSREAWIVCIADKFVSLHESLFRRHM